MPLITLAGIDEAIANLNIKPDTLKGRLVLLIRSHFGTEEDLQEISIIPADNLVQELWEISDSAEIRQKKKNLSSLKSALNKSLKGLTSQGKNPEGLVVSRDNVFSVSDEHKNDLLKQMGITSGQDPLELISTIRELLGELTSQENHKKAAASLLEELDKTRDIIAGMAGMGDKQGDKEDEELGSFAEEKTELETIEKQAGTGGEQQAGDTGDDGGGDGGPEEGSGETEDELEIIEDQEILDDDTEIIDEDELEIIEQDESEEIIEVEEEELTGAGGEQQDGDTGGDGGSDGGSEECSGEDEDGLEIIEEQEIIDDETEIIDEDELEIIEQDESEEIIEVEEEELTGAGGEQQAGDTGSDGGSDGGPEEGSGETEDGLEIIEEQEILDDDTEIIDEDELEIIEQDDSEKIIEVEEEELTGAGGKQQAGDTGGDVGSDGGSEEGSGETEDELEIIEDQEILDDDTEIIDEDELEIIEQDDSEEIIEVDEEELTGADGEQQAGDTGGDTGDDGGPKEGSGETEDGLEIIEEQEILDDDTEIIDEDELEIIEQDDSEEIIEVEEEELTGADEEQPSAAAPMDLSHYIEPDEALTAQPETLVESHEDYINQILERFMPKFIKIPAGNYPVGNFPAKSNERPATHITLDSFHISQLPVTNDLFDFFVRETGYETDAETNNFGTVTEPRMYNRIDPDSGRTILTIRQRTGARRINAANWRHPTGPGSSLENKGNHPVVQISRRDALAFASWAGKRLPTEDEWEAAARGAKGSIFPWGDEWEANLGNFEKSQIGDTCPVTRHGNDSISPFGLYDMLGNVFEWTATVYQPAQTTPLPIYILKGGCWASKSIITTAMRLLERETWSNIIGFRCAV